MRFYWLPICLVLAACATPPSLYEQSSFKQLPWAKHSFEEMRARCKHTSLHYDRQWDYFEVKLPLYKSCMEHYGYLYQGSEGIKTHESKPMTFSSMNETEKPSPETETVENSSGDKSALYR